MVGNCKNIVSFRNIFREGRGFLQQKTSRLTAFQNLIEICNRNVI